MHLTLSLLALGTIFSAATSLIPPDPEVDVVHVKVQGVDEMECEKEGTSMSSKDRGKGAELIWVVCAIHAPIQVGNDIPPVPVPVPSQIQIKLEDDVQDQDRNEDEIEEVLERRKAKGGKGKGGGGGSRGNSSTSSSCECFLE
jgi:hypothetical protein